MFEPLHLIFSIQGTVWPVYLLCDQGIIVRDYFDDLLFSVYAPSTLICQFSPAIAETFNYLGEAYKDLLPERVPEPYYLQSGSEFETLPK